MTDAHCIAIIATLLLPENQTFRETLTPRQIARYLTAAAELLRNAQVFCEAWPDLRELPPEET